MIQNNTFCLLIFLITFHVLELRGLEINQVKIDNIKQHLDTLTIDGDENFALIISKDNNIIFEYSRIPIEKNAIQPLASLSKQFTSFIIFNLIHEGKLNKEDLISKYLEGVPESFNQIKIKNLLNHTSGISDVNVLNLLNGNKQGYYDNETSLKCILNQTKLIFNVGERYEYSNSNYFLLTKIIENVTKRSFKSNLEKYIIDKYFKNELIFIENSDDIQNNINNLNYIFKDIDYTSLIKSNLQGASALFSNLNTFNKWQNILIEELNDNNHIFKKFLNLDTLNNGKIVKDGGGLEILTIMNDTLLHFGGDFQNIHNYSMSLKDDKINVTTFTNFKNTNAKKITNDILVLLLGSSIKNQTNPIQPKKYKKFEKEKFNEFEGVYNVDENMTLSFYFVKNADSTYSANVFQSWDFGKIPVVYKNDSTFVDGDISFIFKKNNINSYDLNVIQNNESTLCKRNKNIGLKNYLRNYYCNVTDNYYELSQSKNSDNIITINCKDENLLEFYQISENTFINHTFVLKFDDKSNFELSHQRISNLVFVKK